ncbi:Hypothetical protein PBC10988_22020 [Planctomycetales bacterium 10988]|nr:Hypothetical protein PBC10988_22020 [Planctomycetales bacterium 10988]
MEARRQQPAQHGNLRPVISLLQRAGSFVCLLPLLCLMGASYRTPNFVVTAPTAEFAKQVGDMAEQYRNELAMEWLGYRFERRWARPCPITVQVGPNLGAGGVTSFNFHNGEVFGWQMSIQGTPERVLDSVLPHEVTHTIFATHFRQPLPRWADEGSCTMVEHPVEKAKQERMLVEFLKTNRGIAFSKMFAMKTYPRDVLPLYSQGYALTRFLVDQGGKKKFIEYLSSGLEDDNWVRATGQFYGYTSLGNLQQNWLEWVRRGTPLPVPGDLCPGHTLAAAEPVANPTRQRFAGQSDASSSFPSAIRQTSQVEVASTEPHQRRGNVIRIPQEPNSGGVRLAEATQPSSMASRTDNHRRDTNDGWYPAGTRQMDPELIASSRESNNPYPVANPAVRPAPSQQPYTPAESSQSARPQPPQPAQQMILEWDENSPAPPQQPGSIYLPRSASKPETETSPRTSKPETVVSPPVTMPSSLNGNRFWR